MNRRKFVKLIGASTPLLLNTSLASASSRRFEGPIVISTWASNEVAIDKAWQTLLLKKNALDAVHEGVKIPESNPDDLSVGLGGLPDRDGKVTLDACVMDHLGNIGSVMALEHIVHASSVARAVMEKTPHVQLVGDGALQFALEQGLKKENLLTPKSESLWKEWMKSSKYNPMTTIEEIEKRIENNHDTIGMIAIDENQNISGMCTTSGLAYKMHGRVGDSPIIGAGLYVDNEIGAATATGMGEEVVRICGSHTIVEAMRYGATPEDACRIALERLIQMKGEKHAQSVQIGFIALNKAGEIGCYSMLPNFTMAIKDSNGAEIIHSKSIFS